MCTVTIEIAYYVSLYVSKYYNVIKKKKNEERLTYGGGTVVHHAHRTA